MLYAQQSFAHEQDIYEWDKNLFSYSGVRVSGHYTLDEIQARLKEELPKIGIPVEFVRDQIQSGNMLSKQVKDCLVLKNAQHPGDYFHFVFTARTTGNMTTIEIFRSGRSYRSGQKNLQEERKGSGSLFRNVLGALTKTDDQGLEEEYDYYAMVADVVKSCFGI